MPFGGGNATIAPPDRLRQLTSAHVDFAYHRIKDPYYEDLVAKVRASINPEEQKRQSVQADIYAISQFWEILVQPIPSFGFSQPWLKRYLPTSDVLLDYKMARLWINQGLKKTMVR